MKNTAAFDKLKAENKQLRDAIQARTIELEQKNRELEIEAALERVRARAMAMHKSEELVEVAILLRKEMGLLGVEELETSSIYIHNEATGKTECWYSIQDQEKEEKLISDHMTIDLKDTWVGQQMLAFYNSEEQQTSIAMQGANRIEWITYCAEKSKLFTVEGFYGEKIPERTYHLYKFNNGYMGAAAPGEISAESWGLLKRATAVFSLAYTRFSDLIKAEAQAREAHIEAALERVRAKTMAMHRSDELGATSLLLFDELKALGEISEQISIGIFDEENQVLNLYATLHGEQWKESTKVDLDEPLVMKKIHGSWKQNKKSIQIDLSGDDLKAYNHFRSQYSNLKFPDERWVIHCAFFSKGVLSFSTTTPHDEQTMQLLERFAQVFDGTYTRFLDLQKAEAQAREAQIEAALERVRARSMAMHHTSEIQAVIHAVHEELLKLNISIHGGSFIVVNADIDTELLCWGAGGTANTSELIHVPHFGMPFCTNLINGIKQGEGFFTEAFTQQEKKEYFTELFKHHPWSELDGKQQKETLNSAGGYTRSCCVAKHTSFFIVNQLGREFTEEENDILKRFSKVFEQTYTRFLDLQKAEAQAREAQIEAALERVRARTMAMHNSEELLETGVVLFKELSKLDVKIFNCGYVLMDDKAKMGWNYGVNPGDGTIRPLPTGIPQTGTKVMDTITASWKRQEPFLIIELDPQETIEHQTFVAENIPNFSLTKEQLLALTPERLVIHTFNFKHGYLLLVDGVKLTTDQQEMIGRFANVFEMTYRRFLDLQKAEAQAREAQIEAAVERVRAEAMAMHSTDDFGKVSRQLLQQIQNLSLKGFTGASIYLVDEHEFFNCYDFSSFGNMGDAKNQFLRYDAKKFPMAGRYPLHQWKKGERYFELDFDIEKLHAAVKEFEEINVDVANSLKEALSGGHLTHQWDACGRLSNGFIAFDMTNPPNDDVRNITVKMTHAFEQAYTRFLDLQRAEEQARKIKLVNQENERLLHSILPQPIAERIRSGQPNVVKRFEQVSILFADIVGFTVLSEKLEPGKVVDILNGLFSQFDDLTDHYGLEKIKTIGDAYMVAAGVPEENADHAMTVFRFAQDMLRSLEEYNQANNSQMKIRIGISSGPVVAGVIGKKKFAYDLWGDSVNTAARMEAYGREDTIQVSPTSYALLKNDFSFEKIPQVNIKGKGVMDVYLWKA